MQDKVKKEFISTLSHEIRTPLTSIKGFSNTILENWEQLSDEQKKYFIKIIEQQSQRLINLVENVLSVSKIEAQENLVLKKTDLYTATKQAVAVICATYKNFEFKINKQKNLEEIFCDNDKLQQILLNLLDNASKYSKNSKIIEINLKNDKNFGIISIKNFGVEIEEKYQEKIYEKFFRINSYLTNSAQGSGLGLYITKTLVEKMNGKIELKSQNNSVEFLVYLPLFEAENITKHAMEIV